MSVIPPDNPRFEDHIVIQSMSQRTVNTRFGQKTVVDVKDQNGRDFQIWPKKDGSMELANQAFALAFDPVSQQPNGATLRIEYTEKPASDPQYPPNRTIEAIGPTTVGAVAAPAPTQPAAPPQQAFAPPPAQPVAAQPAQAASPIPQGSSGPSQDDKIHMRRSAAIKAAATYCAGTGADLWVTAEAMLQWIETGMTDADSIPF